MIMFYVCSRYSFSGISETVCTPVGQDDPGVTNIVLFLLKLRYY